MTFKFGKLAIEAIELGSRGNAVLGIRDSGKTYTATLLAEQLFTAGIPFVAFDPIGVWRFLRVPGAGKGFPVVVAGGQEADLPLTVASAPELVRAAMANGVSLVIDLFDIHLTKADWKRIVTSCVRVLLHENARHGLRHVFIEEAAEFAPQRVGPDQGQVYAEIEKLARMGGNARLGYTLINQRAEEVNKAVLELCDNLFLHRQKGRNSLTALSKWLDIGAVKDHKDIIETLATLPTGECWAWMGGTERPVHVKVPAKQSLHPDRRVMRGDAADEQRPPVNVASFVETMRGTLVHVEAEAKANDPALLKKRIAELERDLRAKPAAEPQRVEIPVLSDEQLRRAHDLAAVLVETGNRLIDEGAAIRRDLARVGAQAGAKTTPIRQARPAISTPQPVRPVQKRTTPASIGVPLPPGEKATLTALAQYPDGLAREQLTVLTGYKRSSRDAYIQRLSQRGYLQVGPRIVATDDGIASLGPDFEPLPTGEALQDYWRAKLPEGERAVLNVLIEAYPDALPREQIDEATGYKRSSRDAYLQRLRAKQLVVIERTGVAASPELFT